MSQDDTAPTRSPDVLNAGILIVDDQETNIVLLEWMLRGAGYQSVTSTTDPTEVGELCRKNSYDLILLDLLMPVMDGFEVMRSLKEIDPDGNLPVLVISAQPNQKQRALQAGAKDFVSKPFELVDVARRIYGLLEVRLLYLHTKALYDRIAVESNAASPL